MIQAYEQLRYLEWSTIKLLSGQSTPQLHGPSMMTSLSCDSNPRQYSCTRLGPLKDALPTELEQRTVLSAQWKTELNVCLP